MPKLRCICDNIINLGEIPSANQLLIISDEEFDNFHGNLDSEMVYSAMKIVAKCNSCERLHFFWNGFENKPEVYTKEKYKAKISNIDE